MWPYLKRSTATHGLHAKRYFLAQVLGKNFEGRSLRPLHLFQEVAQDAEVKRIPSWAETGGRGQEKPSAHLLCNGRSH